MIYEDPADKKTYFPTLRSYYTDDSELKRVKENRYNSRYYKFVIYELNHGGMHLIGYYRMLPKTEDIHNIIKGHTKW